MTYKQLALILIVIEALDFLDRSGPDAISQPIGDLASTVGGFLGGGPGRFYDLLTYGRMAGIGLIGLKALTKS